MQQVAIGRLAQFDAVNLIECVEAEWSATVEDLVKTLNKFKVPAKEQQELLAIIGPMKKDIVGQ